MENHHGHCTVIHRIPWTMASIAKKFSWRGSLSYHCVSESIHSFWGNPYEPSGTTFWIFFCALPETFERMAQTWITAWRIICCTPQWIKIDPARQELEDQFPLNKWVLSVSMLIYWRVIIIHASNFTGQHVEPEIAFRWSPESMLSGIWW